eukprot:1160616-Pelagomonas_calceolata.AAC.6
MNMWRQPRQPLLYTVQKQPSVLLAWCGRVVRRDVSCRTKAEPATALCKTSLWRPSGLGRASIQGRSPSELEVGMEVTVGFARKTEGINECNNRAGYHPCTLASGLQKHGGQHHHHDERMSVMAIRRFRQELTLWISQQESACLVRQEGRTARAATRGFYLILSILEANQTYLDDATDAARGLAYKPHSLEIPQPAAHS